MAFDGAPEGARGLLTFDPNRAAELEIPPSTNNVSNQEAPVAGYDRDVPPECAHFVATGTCNGVVRRLEAILAIPTYKYAIACTGKFKSVSGGMEVEGIEDPEALADGVISDEERRPGHIASNHGSDDAIVLNGVGSPNRPPWTELFNPDTEQFEYVVYTNTPPAHTSTGWSPEIIAQAVPPAGETRPAVYFKNEDVGWVLRYDFNSDGNPEDVPLLQYVDIQQKPLTRAQAKAADKDKPPFEWTERFFFQDESPNDAKNGFLVDRFRLAARLYKNDPSVREEGVVRFDPNQFIQFARKTRLILWRPLD
ncbi:MAG: hypothetical protein HY319_13745 [Armatimonadetes bacterium]|nr:hypothetical protein [Armatimonadota bacterium]